MGLKLALRWVVACWLLFGGSLALALDAPDVVSQGEALAREASAAAAQGAVLPAGLLATASQAQEVSNTYGSEELARLSSLVEGYLVELRELAVTPGVAGTTRFLTTGPLTVGSNQNITQVYEVPQTLAPGAAIRLGRLTGQMAPRQSQFPSEPGYVSVSAGGVTFAATTIVDPGLAGGLHGPVAEHVFEVTGGELAAGSQVTIRYQSLDIPATNQRHFRLPLQVKLTPNGPWLHVPGDELLIVAGSAARLVAHAPAQVAVGSPFVVGLRLEDEFGNLATGTFPSLEVLLDGAFVTRVAAGPDPTPIFSLTIGREGAGEIEVRSSGGGLVTKLNVEATSAESSEIQWPVLFAHTLASDGIQTAAEVTASLANTADGVVIIENDAWLDQAAWQARPVQLMDGFARTANVRSGGQQVILVRDRLSFSEPPRVQLQSPRALREFLASNEALAIALPEVPAHPAMLDAGATRLASIKAGDGTFEWYGNRLAAAGFRVGFVGSPYSHTPQVGKLATKGRTAVSLLAGESLFDSLLAGRTWVTSGPAISLEMRLNDTEPGGRAPRSEIRQVVGRVQGTAPIQTIELIRNGEVIATRRYARNPASRTVKLTFFSSSEPLYDQIDVPRNGREWIGFLQVTGAEIVSLDASNFRNRMRQAAAVNPSLANRIDFITWTRGHPSSFYFDLAPEGSESDSSVLLELSLAEGFEDSAQLALGRPPAAIPAARMLFDLAELTAGSVIREYPVSGYQDTVIAELVDIDVPSDVSFEFVDRREFGEGDYYYVRITQADDHMAWSSPVYVGGFDLR